MRGLSWMRAAGLEERTARTFAATFCSPLGDELEESLICALEMFFGELEGQVSAEDWASYRRLVECGSPDFIASQPDYAGLVTYTMLLGTRWLRG